jgi:hypothetical protein
MQGSSPKTAVYMDRMTAKDILWLPLTFLGIRDDREIRFIKGLRRFQQDKLLRWDFRHLTRKERLDLINEYSRSIYLRKHTKATNRLSLIAVVIAGLNGYIASENLKESRKATDAKSFTAKPFVANVSYLEVRGGKLLVVPAKQITARHVSIPGANPR